MQPDPQVEEIEDFDEYEVEPVLEPFVGELNTPCYGVLCVEGVETGDYPRREFAPDSLTWATPPIALKWQPAEGPGHDGAMIAGRIDYIWRDGALIRFIGCMDSMGVIGAEAERLMAGQFLRGVSLMGDDVTPTDVELLYPDEAGPDLSADQIEGAEMLLIEGPQPIKEVTHKARIRSATLLPEPAFVEAIVCLGESPHQPPMVEIPQPVEALIASAVAVHETATSDGAWDGPANEQRLPSPMPMATARAFYAFIDDAVEGDEEIPKTAGRFGHHEVSADGTPGAANIRACQTGIGVLNGGRGGTTIPAEDVQGVYDHLAAHLRSADLEPPPLEAATKPAGPVAVTAAAYTITIPEVWPEEWFDEPTEMPPFGALHITASGRVFGLLAPAGASHRAFRASGRHITVPMGVDYSEFNNKACLVAGADGGVYRINAGNITFDCGHADPFDARRADPTWATQHYDNSCSIAARVRIGESRRFGAPWVAGALLHGITPNAVEQMMGCALSGDWQDNKLKAALLVPVEGFAAPVTASVRVRDDALVASSVPVLFDAPPPPPDYDAVFDLIASANNRDPASRYAELAAQRFAEYASEVSR